MTPVYHSLTGWGGQHGYMKGVNALGLIICVKELQPKTCTHTHTHTQEDRQHIIPLVARWCDIEAVKGQMNPTRRTPCGNDRETKATNLSKKLLRRKPSMFSIWVLWQEKYIESHCNSTNTSQHSNFKTVTEGRKQTKPPTHPRLSPKHFYLPNPT